MGDRGSEMGDRGSEIRNQRDVGQMTYKRFEALPVWNDAIRLAELVLGLSGSGMFRSMSGFKDQIERAVVSVSNNIAEGFERGTDAELTAFLYYSKGSVAEVRSMLCLLRRVESNPDHLTLVEAPHGLSESISRQLCGWIEHIRSTDFQGDRTKDARTRQQNEQARRAEAFTQKSREMIDKARQTSLTQPPQPERDPMHPPR